MKTVFPMMEELNFYVTDMTFMFQVLLKFSPEVLHYFVTYLPIYYYKSHSK